MSSFSISQKIKIYFSIYRVFHNIWYPFQEWTGHTRTIKKGSYKYVYHFVSKLYIYKLCDSTNSQIHFAWNVWKIAKFFHAMTGSFIIHIEHFRAPFTHYVALGPLRAFSDRTLWNEGNYFSALILHCQANDVLPQKNYFTHIFFPASFPLYN